MKENLYNNIFNYIRNKESQKALDIIESENLDINEQNENEESLIEAFINENYDDYIFVSNLVSTFANKINIQKQNKFGMTILHLLLSFNFVKETILLLNRNRKNFKLVENNNRETILTIAKKNNIENLIEIIEDLKNKKQDKVELTKEKILEEKKKTSSEDDKLNIKNEDNEDNKDNKDNEDNEDNEKYKEIKVKIKNKRNSAIINMIVFNEITTEELEILLEISNKENKELFNIIKKFQKNKEELFEENIIQENEEKNLNLMKNTKEVIQLLKEIFEIFEKNNEVLITEEVFEELKEILPTNEERNGVIIPNLFATKFTLIKINDKINKNLEKI